MRIEKHKFKGLERAGSDRNYRIDKSTVFYDSSYLHVV